jgi:hypothetical protein
VLQRRNNFVAERRRLRGPTSAGFCAANHTFAEPIHQHWRRQSIRSVSCAERQGDVRSIANNRTGRGQKMPGRLRALVFGVSVLVSGLAQGGPQDASQQEMRSLDEQVQEIKSDVLSIAADLSRLEEKLLYPSNTQLAIFVSINPGETFRLDAMKIDIDGATATHYIYSYKELEALQKGGVQRIYTGNIPTGSHEIAISVNGKTQTDKDFTRTETFAFDKGVEPKLLGVTLAGPETIQLGDW